ncbi:transglycosylase SLT domain-containing protein [Aliikangiella sp. G2MR2-5]|uniref:transglycosylase SLT domain-containing protein n=1 Tax=Aliikangiella sp. G2MR2-5 TaxID=2788943 RepID=UPI001AEE3E17|nr:transglycosylase SLT domain-containing protein [Aliikangiella sp. G2MR2-5]
MAKERKLFQQAEEALNKKQFVHFNQLRKELQSYPLKYYLERDYLLNDLSLKHSEAISTFLTQHGDQPVSRKLRYKWLYWLAENNHGSLFLRHYQNLGSITLKCHYLKFQLKQTGLNNDINSQISNLWLTGSSLPKACDRLFTSWNKVSPVDDNLIWRRLLLAYKKNNNSLAKYLTSRLSSKSKGAASLLAKTVKNPDILESTDFRQPLTSRAEDIITLGLSRLAWKNPNKAIEIWQRLGEKFDYHTSSNELRRIIALSLAIDKEPAASFWLESLGVEKDESVNQWFLSTALENGDWEKVAYYSRALSDKDKDTHKWNYWLGVAETQLGNLTEARATFSKIAHKRSYYGFLAARQLNQKASLSQKPVEFTFSELSQIAQEPAAQRAFEFYQMNRLGDARREWNHLVAKTSNDQQIKLAALAYKWGWQHQAILAFARSKQIDDVEKRFPLAYLDTYVENTQKHNIPLSWAFAVTRQESAFKTDARSSANARGLMQLTPATAKQVSMHSSGYRSPSQLYTAETNIKLGTAHLAKMYRSFNNNPILATAAYNAGRTRVVKWIENSTTSDPIHWIEQIPYKETREYVKNVLTYQLIYAQLTRQPESFIGQIEQLSIASNNNNPLLPIQPLNNTELEGSSATANPQEVAVPPEN